MAVCVAVIGKEVRDIFCQIANLKVPFHQFVFCFTSELPVISSNGFSRRRAKISLHSAHVIGCCRGEG